MASGDKPGGPLRAALRGITLPLARATINVRLIAIVLTLAVPLNIVIGVVIWRLASAAFEAERTSLVYSGRSLTNAVDAVFSRSVALGQLLAHDPSARADDLTGFAAELREQLRPMRRTTVLIADPDGRPLFTTALPDGIPPKPRPLEAVAAQRRAAETGTVVISDIYRPPWSRHWVATAEVAVYDKDGTPLRGLAVSMDARQFVDLLAVQDLPRNWEAVIRDSTGRIVTRVPDPNQWAGEMAKGGFLALRNQTGLFQVVSSRSGDEYLTSNAQTRLGGWTVGVGIRTADLRAVVINAIAWPLAFAAVISLMSLVFAVFIARRMTAPLAELRQKAAAVLGDQHVDFEPGVPELSELWTALLHGAATRRRSEAVARATEKRLSQIINTYNGFVGLLDRDGLITEANVQMLNAIGAPREQVIGQAFVDIGWWSHAPQARREIR
jgi:PAS domain-containing protein